MTAFSQRKGIKPTAEVLQVNSMTEELRNSLWNALDVAFWSTKNFVYAQYGYGEIEEFSRQLWFNYFKKPVDSRPDNGSPDRGGQILKEIRSYFFACSWNEVYDFLEFLVHTFSGQKPRLQDYLNTILTREFAGYRFIDGHVVDITDKQERAMLEEALGDKTFVAVGAHLARALELLSDRTNPDYRNSIKESVSAVEAMARIIADAPRATLGEALKVLERVGHLHPALKEGFLKLYGYASDEQGIRHAMLNEPNISQADAKYFLLSCTSFVNYLKANVQ